MGKYHINLKGEVAICRATPIVYDNTDIVKKIDFNEFRKGHRESTTIH